MKRFLLVVLALAMMAGIVFAEEGTAPMPDGAKAFEGVWQCDRASIAVDREEEGFKVLITWGSSAWEHTEWQYSCYYKDEDQTLAAVPFGTRTDFVYGDDGGIVSATEIYQDGEAVFSLDAEGYLIWQDQKENAGEGMRFEKLPEEPASLLFATIGEAMASEGYTGIAGSDSEHYVAVVRQDDAYIRLVADLDEKAKELSDATLEYVDADTLEAAFAAYNAHIETLPVAYEEEITAQPKSQEELDALAGKTLLEAETAGYESSSSAMGENDEAIYTVSNGLYTYDLLLNETYTEYMEHNDNGYIGDLTIRSAALSGLSHNAAELRFHADGTYDEEKDDWAEFNGIMEMISGALSGENPEEAIQALTEAMPEHAEEIGMLAELFSSMSGQEEETGKEAEKAAQAEDPFYILPITDEIFARIYGKSFKEDCTLPREDLRYLHVLHTDLNGETREGEMIVNYHIAEDVLDIFRQLYEAGYPIEKIRLVDEYDADDALSMEDNNSSSFNFRFISHTTRISKHGLGLAVDINTLYNPYTKIVDGVRIVEPVTGEPYLDREADFPCKIDHEDLCYRLFIEHGFEWGGDWENRKDYQHFEIPTDVIAEWYPDNQ